MLSFLWKLDKMTVKRMSFDLVCLVYTIFVNSQYWHT